MRVRKEGRDLEGILTRLNKIEREIREKRLRGPTKTKLERKRLRENLKRKTLREKLERKRLRGKIFGNETCKLH